MKKCLSCKASYGGHGTRCSLDGEDIEYINKCVFPEVFEEWKRLAKDAGYFLYYIKKEKKPRNQGDSK